ncbi:CDP-alcohol phosphatidyltransferase [Geodermatophilus pulveris]|uniref:CDP-alcohol phosphatidyltransferase n=1 Tax=Geodermatophilus pulveris TaxID=1564159 RepID=A0A239GX96_9ACTN|nr:CDP-alcohol phosphatidyltransferase family protein [Geodermatophilus pulveris]SNS73561.1 CDP-alcohol phosphatidyltransferase [Geodermatophilus pulveris]
MTATVQPTPADLRTTLRRLAAAQKGSTGAPAYSRFVNRPLGRLFAALAFAAGLTPNAVTAASAAATATGIALLVLVPPSVPVGVAVAACLVLGYGLDAADGQLARLRGGGSPAGEWLDHMVDAAKLLTLHLAVLVALYRSGAVEAGPLLLVPIGYCIADGVLFFAMLLNEALRAQHGVATRAQPSAGTSSLRRSLLSLPTDYGVLALSFLLWGVPAVFLSAYAVLFLATAAHLAIGSGKWFREMGGLPR